MKRNSQQDAKNRGRRIYGRQRSTTSIAIVTSTPSDQLSQLSATAPVVQHDQPEPVVNQAAVDLLESWQAGDEQEQRDTWEYLKRVLEEDRLSDRTIFP